MSPFQSKQRHWEGSRRVQVAHGEYCFLLVQRDRELCKEPTKGRAWPLMRRTEVFICFEKASPLIHNQPCFSNGSGSQTKSFCLLLFHLSQMQKLAIPGCLFSVTQTQFLNESTINCSKGWFVLCSLQHLLRLDYPLAYRIDSTCICRENKEMNDEAGAPPSFCLPTSPKLRWTWLSRTCD